jgi:prolyl-tRNA editing enzyme YbaK/EbsC (Cys-tRNA(Pro) deacylase)
LNQSEQERIEQLKHSLDAASVNFKIFAHDGTVKSAEEGVARGFGDLKVMAPTFILNSEIGYLAAIISGETRLSYKKIKKQLGLKNVSLATSEQVKQVTGAQIGTVALVNPELRTIVDSRLMECDIVYGGCGVSDHSLQVKVDDLIRVTQAHVFDFTELKVSGENHKQEVAR